MSAFRIVQEAVTNVVRHAGTGCCQVVIDRQDGQLSIEVTDSGRGGAAGTCYGITGMRERAALLGGDLSAGPRPGGGIRARLLVLTTFDDDDCVYGALRAGASGFLVKDMALEDILAAIRVIAASDAIIAPGVTRRLIEQFTSQPPAGRESPKLSGITGREREDVIFAANVA